MGAGLDLIIDGQDLAIFANVEGLTRGVLAFAQDHAKSLCGFACRVAQDGVICFEGFGKLLVGFGVVATGSEIGDIEFADLLTARTERFAFRRSATGESLGEPGDYDWFLAFEIGELVSLAIASLQGKVRRRIADLWRLRSLGVAARKEESAHNECSSQDP